MAESSHQWTPRHIIPQLRHTLEPQSIRLASLHLWLKVCVSVLTELALLGLGHGRPVPGPLDSNESIKMSLGNVSKGCKSLDWFRVFHVHEGSHVDSWHSRTHGVVWRPHPTTKVLRGQTKNSLFYQNHMDLFWLHFWCEVRLGQNKTPLGGRYIWYSEPFPFSKCH